ncbi:ribonuclease E/G [Zavarzinia sp. CC-PAN008]|uniref:ribonuclease E/G n=1 Tax=Zavarzinia sp. CC-PAN008 TaxID=3243332 RepID=UPI003F743053
MVTGDELLIDRTGAPGGRGLVRAALRRGGRLVALRLDPDPPPAVQVGSLWLGRVRQPAGPQGLFVDLGQGPWGLLRTGRQRLVEGDAVAVRVAAIGIAAKGPRLAADLALPGRLLVLHPGRPPLGDDLPASAHGAFTRRSAALGLTAPDLAEEAARLDRLWAQVAGARAAARAPAQLWRAPAPVASALRDLAPPRGRVAVEGAALFAAARRYAQAEAPDLLGRLERHGGTALFDAAGVGDELDALVGTRIDLPGGAWLAVEETHALVAVDVNAGPRKGARTVNVDAAAEIARQIALRGLGGLVVIDFLRTGDAAERKAIAADLAAACAAWELDVQAHGFTRGGLFELSCVRTGPSLRERLAALAQEAAPAVPSHEEDP